MRAAWWVRALAVVVWLSSTHVIAAGVDGLGQVSIGGGYRWLPNWWFKDKAAAAGTPVVPGLDGGPQGLANFSLGVSSVLSVSIDLVFAYSAFELQRPDGGRDAYSSVTAGALAGGRLSGLDVLFKGFMPYLDVQAGPILAVIGGPRETIPEKVLLGLSAAVGATYRFTPSYGLTLEVRYLQARATVPDISGINVGGVWFSAMFTIFFPPPLKRDLEPSSF